MPVTAQNIIAKAYNNKRNFMTPDIIRFDRKGKMAYELSSGDGIEAGTKMFGLSVVHYNDHTGEITKERGLSDCYPSLEEAETAIKKLPRYRYHNSRGE